jgi:hypothetical protein
MGKIIVLLGFLNLCLFADELSISEQSFTNSCISCHQQQQIPSSLIYKRYLMKYSTDVRMEEAMFKYLKDPKKESSIMPVPFFLKFPMKDKVEMDDLNLHKNIRVYLDTFDIKKKLILE